ncbi:FAD-dependent oxidoreductase [Actinacidiphila glaucinigra]|uniref:NAD(P)/FAD-dependent oxidoreductase n=2 Tax=Actinacidiphila glaucinigra TaxID=235986 RepID=UPI002DD88977|nr:FAD-dependent oxidoreductase [Actinacidiphila glaucinigra]WSD62214.1 FAD-dependent oxidoreductase [Actinacidiphila glaucinigra]
MRMVVVGGGMAGARLAQRLAPSGADVTVVGEERHAPYNRVLLAEVLAGRYAPEAVALPGVPGAAVRRGVRVVRIDRAERAVVCDDGGVLRYDRLVLATGSNPVLPPLRGLFAEDSGSFPEGVHAFRTMDDCLALSAAVRPGARAVVVGGGLLGVSAARALAARGAQVVVATQGEHLMERHLDASAAELLRAHLEGLGVEVHTQCRVRGLLTRDADGGAEPSRQLRLALAARTGGTPAGARPLTLPRGAGGEGRAARPVVTAVELADGYRLGTDLVVLACGVRPRVGLAQAAGLAVARGVVVDDALRTSDPSVHAIGDCAQHAGVVYGLAGPATEQADALADVLTAGPAPRYGGTRSLTRLTLNGPAALDIASFGETTPAPGDDVLRLADATRGAYRKVVLRGDRLVGGILLGDLGTVGTLARTWEGDEPLPSPPLHLLTDNGGS